MTTPAPARQAGFTLIELMVTLTIAAIVLTTAVPALTTYQRNAELVAATTKIISSLNVARSESLKRGMNTLMIPAFGSSWNNGWIVFVDVDRSGTFSAGDVTISTQAALGSALGVTGTQTAGGGNPYVLFDASGYAKTTAGAFGAVTLVVARNDMDSASAYTQTRMVKIAQTGRVRTCKPASASDSNCSATVED